MRRSMSASTLEIVILCMTMSMMRRSSVCHFWRADLEKLLALPAAAMLPRPAGLRCSFFRLLEGDEERKRGLENRGEEGGFIKMWMIQQKRESKAVTRSKWGNTLTELMWFIWSDWRVMHNQPILYMLIWIKHYCIMSFQPVVVSEPKVSGF